LKASFKTAIHDLFTKVAPHYDRMNDLMSLGWQRFWKAYFVQNLPFKQLPSPMHYLDMASGTGDIGNLVFQYAKEQKKEVFAYFADPNETMIAQAQSKSLYSDSIQWTCTGAEKTPFLDTYFDLYTIAFGLRNVENRHATLMEAFRILKPGSFFYCLEFSHLIHAGLVPIYHAYLYSVLPLLGKKIAGDRAPYDYLRKSILEFPSQPMLAMELNQAGFSQVGFCNLSSGIVAIHWGIKP
jgi:demethylmenaquinone methyltransferase/2-methoxy-6-polyprenyl-1,4-benzoquinol methylase